LTDSFFILDATMAVDFQSSAALVGNEPPEMIEGEEGDEEEEEDEGDRTESDSEALSQESAGRTRCSKRGATSSSQTSPEEPTKEEEEETTSRLRGRQPLLVRTSPDPSDCGRPS
jgi:hypothetical protein